VDQPQMAAGIKHGSGIGVHKSRAENHPACLITARKASP
jgi:hypothetical protein